jgi:hypothetical protein
MRYLPPFLLLLLLTACGQEREYDYDDDREDPWEDYDPEVSKHTYDEAYVPPTRMNADQLVERAKKAEADGRDDQARVDYHAAFRRDRWHPTANAGYQDLMLRNDLFETVWQEYLDLWQQNGERGDALWFHLRPMLQQRNDAVTLEKAARLNDEDALRVEELTAQSREAAEAGDRDAALDAINAALKIADHTSLHRTRIELLAAGDFTALLEEYADYADENPASGDRLYLHAHVLSYRDPVKALAMLREGWIIELPGYWLRFGIAEICTGMGDNDANTERRSALGWYAAARAFLEQCLEARPSDADAATMLAHVRNQLSK